MTARPFYVVFAGVNGAGKSTLFRTGLWRDASMPSHMARVNPDEIVVELGGDWRAWQDQRRAGKLAVERVSQYLERGQSFNQETTLCGHLAIKNIMRAYELGYRVFLNYVGVRDASVALDRIAHRVSLGGHDIDEQVVRRRMRASLAGLAQVLGCCEQVAVFDNTHEFNCLAQWHQGTLAWWGNPRAHGAWLLDAMADETRWRR